MISRCEQQGDISSKGNTCMPLTLIFVNEHDVEKGTNAKSQNSFLHIYI